MKVTFLPHRLGAVACAFAVVLASACSPSPATDSDGPQLAQVEEIVAAHTIGEERAHGRTVAISLRIPHPISEAQAQQTATAYARSCKDESEGCRAFFLIPGQSLGSSAWGVVTFPGAEVEIFGPSTQELAAAKRDMPKVDGELVGEWIDTTPTTGGRLRIFKRRGGYFVQTMYFGADDFAPPLKLKVVRKEQPLGFQGVEEEDRRKYMLTTDGFLEIWSSETGNVVASPIPLSKA